MNCPVHVSSEMIPIEIRQAPRMKQRGRGLSLGQEEFEARSENLVVVRCIVPKCPRVDILVEVKKAVKLCPSCGRESDAPGYRKMIGDHRCVACRRRRLKYWARRRRMEKRA